MGTLEQTLTENAGAGPAQLAPEAMGLGLPYISGGRGCCHPAPHLAVRDCGLNPCAWAYLQGEKEGYAKGFGEIWLGSRGTFAIYAHDGMRVSRLAATLPGVLDTSSTP